MPKSLKSLAPLGLVLGFGGLVAAAVMWLLQRQFDMPVRVALAVGVLGFALAALFDPNALLKWLRGRQARYGSNVAFMTVAFVGILIIVNYLVITGPLPAEWKRHDFTQDQTNTLTPETLAALQKLPGTVNAVGFYSTSAASQKESALKLLESYRVASAGKLTYEFHDPLGEPALAKAYNVTRDATLVLALGQERQEPLYVAESEVTGALIRLSNPTTRVIYFLTGHGERDLTTTGQDSLSSSVDLLKKQNYDVRPLSLQVTSTVPADARELVIAGPLTPLAASEVKAIGDYLSRGGALVALLDPTVQGQADAAQTDPLVDYLANTWGLNVQQDVVVDLYNSYYDGQNAQPLFPLDGSYGSSPITDRLQSVRTGFPVARSIAVFGTAEAFPDIKYTPLIMTDARAWGETDFASLGAGQSQLGAGDVPGPMNLAVSAENTKTQARLVVIGDSDFVSNQYYQGGANALLLLNSINWASLEESLINVSPRVPTTRTLNIFGALTMNVIFFIVVVVMPLSVAGLGVVVWFLRRRHI